MPSIFSRLMGAGRQPVAEAKASRAGALLAMHSLGQPRWTQRTSTELTRQGYERNAIVYRCVRLIAENAAAIPWLVYENGEDDSAHPLAQLLARPNMREAGPAFLEAVFSNLTLFGNAYIEAVSLEGAPRELYCLRPDRMNIVAGANGWPSSFEYRIGADIVRYHVEPDGRSPILHLRLFHPLDDHYGFAPLNAAQTPLDVHNAAASWSKALLDNSARPSGALVYAGPGGALSDEQFDRLKTELDENFSGARNAGRPLLLEGGLDWKALSLSPKDMDFAAAKHDAAREIALAFGVPPLLLGLPGDNTHSNYQEANRAFWRQTIIPLVKRTQKSFEAWLAFSYPGASFAANLDGLEALSAERESEWRRVGAAEFLSDDEKRAALGYAPLARSGKRKGNRFISLKFRADQARDDQGRWTEDGRGGPQPDAVPFAGGANVHLAGKRGGISLDERGLSVQDFVSQRCTARIYEVLPGQFLETSIDDVLSQKRAGNNAARQCIKLLNEGRFRK